jgi:8-oxo-dGTP diphosphatase
MSAARTILLERHTNGSQQTEHRIVLTSESPPFEHVTAAMALAFEGERFLLADLVQRGLDIPGGHVSDGETPEEAMRREVYEETGARLGPARVLAYEQFKLLGPKPPDFPFPYPDSFLVFFYAQVESLDPFVPNEESRGRALLDPGAARATRWVQRNAALYESALQSTLLR